MAGLHVGIMGTGGVGIATASSLLFQGLAGRLTLYARSGDKAQGEALDYLHAMPLLPSAEVRGWSFEEVEPEDVLILTVGAHTEAGAVAARHRA